MILFEAGAGLGCKPNWALYLHYHHKRIREGAEGFIYQIIKNSI